MTENETLYKDVHKYVFKNTSSVCTYLSNLWMLSVDIYIHQCIYSYQCVSYFAQLQESIKNQKI